MSDEIADRVDRLELPFDAAGVDPYGISKWHLKHAYRTRSVLAMPLRDARGTVFGVLQLINRRTEQGDVVAFDDHGEAVVRGLVTTSELG